MNTLPHNHFDQTNYKNIQEVIDNGENFQVVSNIFKQLSDTTRIRIFWLLCHCEECVVNIAAMMNMSSPAVSHHLKTLKDNNLITARRDGKEVYYRASFTAQSQLLHEMIELITQIACPESEDATSIYKPSDVFSCVDDSPTNDHSSDSTTFDDSRSNHVCHNHMGESAVDQQMSIHTNSSASNKQGFAHPDAPVSDKQESTYVDSSITSLHDTGYSNIPSFDHYSHDHEYKGRSEHFNGLRDEPIDTDDSSLTRYQAEQIETIKKIHDQLIAHMDSRLTVDELAREYLMNATTLKQLFKKVYGMSIAAHIKEHRMEHAAYLLKNTSMSIGDIAQHVGYDNQSKFTAAFKEHFGMLPKEFRK